MFKVENADFIAEKLASELLPNQEFREVAKNAEEAIRRRFAVDPGSPEGRIEFDVDWSLLEEQEGGAWHICCADDGDGMSRAQLEKYTTTLAVQGAGRNQSVRGNQGMGLKISGPTRHKEGVLIRSMRHGELSMVQIGWDKEKREYGLIPLGDRGELIVHVPDKYFPEFIRQRGSGTVVTFLGNSPGENTFWPQDGRPRTWLSKYLNQRFARLSIDGIEVVVRIAQGSLEDWPTTREEADARQRKVAGKKQFNFNGIDGTFAIWEKACGDGSFGVLELPGEAGKGIPRARLHWWVLPVGAGTDVTTRTAGGSSLAVLFQNELHDWRRGAQSNALFARMGILFAKSRFAFILEPLGEHVLSDFARAKILISGVPIFESDSWTVWSEQFRENLPEAIRRTIREEQASLHEEDPERAKRIQNRLEPVMKLLRPRRVRRNPAGEARGRGPSVSGPGDDPGDGPHEQRASSGGQRNPGPRRRGIGALLSQQSDGEELASTVSSSMPLEPRWVSETEAEGFPIVSGDDSGLKDRAAGLAGEDAITAGLLLLNHEFRGFQTLLAYLGDEVNPEGNDDKARFIEDHAREWVEQKIIECVQGLRQLENGSTWLGTHYDDALSPVALTAAFMADRYHTLREVKRAVGNLKQKTPMLGD